MFDIEPTCACMRAFLLTHIIPVVHWGSPRATTTTSNMHTNRNWYPDPGLPMSLSPKRIQGFYRKCPIARLGRATARWAWTNLSREEGRAQRIMRTGQKDMLWAWNGYHWANQEHLSTKVISFPSSLICLRVSLDAFINAGGMTESYYNHLVTIKALIQQE